MLVAVLIGLVMAVTLTNILRTLACMRKHDLDIHNIVRESRQLRNDYLVSLAERMGEVGSGVEIVDDEPS